MNTIPVKYFINKFYITIADTDNGQWVDVLVFEKKGTSYGSDYYINLHKDARFPIDFSTAPKQLKAGENLSNESEEQQNYRIEYIFYLHRKDQGQPMWRLHRSTLDRVLEICRRLE